MFCEGPSAPHPPVRLPLLMRPRCQLFSFLRPHTTPETSPVLGPFSPLTPPLEKLVCSHSCGICPECMEFHISEAHPGSPSFPFSLAPNNLLSTPPFTAEKTRGHRNSEMYPGSHITSRIRTQIQLLAHVLCAFPPTSGRASQV